jgi:hypothetical protein
VTGDRYNEYLDRDYTHTHLTEEGLDEMLWLVWDGHHGVEECDCLRYALGCALAHDEALALDVMRNCIAEHPAGEKYRECCEAELTDDLVREFG